MIYGSAFDLMVQVADYTITEGEWLEIVTGDAALKPLLKRALKPTVNWAPKLDAKHKQGVAPVGAGAA